MRKAAQLPVDAVDRSDISKPLLPHNHSDTDREEAQPNQWIVKFQVAGGGPFFETPCGRPDHLPDDIDIVLWAKLALYTRRTLSKYALQRRRDEVAFLVGIVMLWIALTFYISGLADALNATGITVMTCACSVLAIVAALALYECRTRKKRAKSSSRDIEAMLQKHLRPAFLSRGFDVSLSGDGALRQYTIQRMSSQQATERLQQLETDDIDMPVDQVGVAAMSLQPLQAEQAATVADLPPVHVAGYLPRAMLSIHKDPGVSRVDAVGSEMVWGVVREVHARSCRLYNKCLVCATFVWYCVWLFMFNGRQCEFAYMLSTLPVLLLVDMVCRVLSARQFGDVVRDELSAVLYDRYGCKAEYKVRRHAWCCIPTYYLQFHGGCIESQS